MTERDPALAPFEALIGTWITEATHPEFDGVVPGTRTFEWLEGGHFLVLRSLLRSWRDHPGFDQRSEAAVGPDGFVEQSQLARTAGDWKDDLRVVYRRAG